MLLQTNQTFHPSLQVTNLDTLGIIRNLRSPAQIMMQERNLCKEQDEIPYLDGRMPDERRRFAAGRFVTGASWIHIYGQSRRSGCYRFKYLCGETVGRG